MSNGLTRFLGDTPGRTILKLLVASFVVGVVMAAFNWYPIDVWYWVRDFVARLWENGFAALGRFGTYLALGAAVVIPVFIVMRLISFRR
ncbi:DUF6460 domain-containing protein [Hoeflea sp.]|uniref:DUF6460 domain-containing protein n=1 Tax=Hoeflea sp. TaxID=1940281 RepID=UPI003BB0FACB